MTEIREFVPRDASRRQERKPAANPPAENLNSLIGRVAGASMEEIDQSHRRAATRTRHAAQRKRTVESGDCPLCQLKPFIDDSDEDHQ